MQSQRERSNSTEKKTHSRKSRSKRREYPAQSLLGSKNDEEEDLKLSLFDLATPKVFEGPEVDIQSRIVEKLESLIQERITQKLQSENKNPEDKEERAKKEAEYASAHFIGAIELTEPLNGRMDDLLSSAKLIDLPTQKQDGYGNNMVSGHSLGKGDTLFDMVGKAGLEGDIIQNTLATMATAGQLTYLMENGLINKDWKTVIEVHYYRDRDKNMTGLHKDTLGQTLFVNLNFQNKEEVAGPEYIINPASRDDYDQYVSGNLPKAVVDDLITARKKLPTPDEFGASTIPQYGVVAFVDEIIHHKTPMLAHRKVSAKAIAEQYPDVEQAYKNYKKRSIFSHKKSFTHYLDQKYHNAAQDWFDIMAKTDDEKAMYDRTELAKILSAHDIDQLIEKEWSDGVNSVQFDSAKVPNVSRRLPVKAGKHLLKRQMSQNLIDGNAPKPSDARRTFFRTWVRLVPTLNNPEHTVTASEIASARENSTIRKAYRKYRKREDKNQPFADFLDGKNSIAADQWLSIMRNRKDDQTRLYKNGLHQFIKETLK